MLGRYFSERLVLQQAGIRKKYVNATAFGFDCGVQTIKVVRLGIIAAHRSNDLPIYWTAHESSGCRRPKINTYALSSTNRLAVLSPIPLLPPVITAVFPRNLFMTVFVSSRQPPWIIFLDSLDYD
jgi:hypothetical protein